MATTSVGFWLSLSQNRTAVTVAQQAKPWWPPSQPERNQGFVREHTLLCTVIRWLWVFNQLYYWNDTYYEAVDTNAEISRINHYCDSYEGRCQRPGNREVVEIVTYPYVDLSTSTRCLIDAKLSIDSKRINPWTELP